MDLFEMTNDSSMGLNKVSYLATTRVMYNPRVYCVVAGAPSTNTFGSSDNRCTKTGLR